MTKAEDGLWSVTLGPLAPAIYDYTFRVDGVAVIDPVNPMIKPGERTSASMFEIRGDQPAPYDFQAVPHGTVHVSYYDSKALGVPRRIDVYTPPGYETRPRYVPGAVPAPRVGRYRGGVDHHRAREPDFR